MEIIIEDNNNGLPVARPSPADLVSPPAPLDFTEFAAIFDEWLPPPTPGEKRKIGHRRDDPPTRPSPRQPPPPIIPRRTLPPKDPNQPLIGESIQSSPIVKNNKNKQQHSFYLLLPIENQNKSSVRDQLITHEPSMIVPPMQSSTPKPLKKSSSAIPKNHIEQHSSFNFAIMPIECRYQFKKTRQRCTFETIRIHQEFLENKCRTLEDESENKLHAAFPKQIWAKIVEFVKNTVENPLESKKNSDKKRLDNLLLDQMRQKAILEIEKKGTSIEQEHIYNLHEKFMRKLNLQLQLDKLEKRFTENLPPPSLNIFDKLDLHAKELKKDNNHLKSLREQWKNILRKTKLDLTSLMRQAKIIEIEEANKQYQELEKKLSEHLRKSYDIICHVSRTRHNKFAKKKLNFLEKRAYTMSVN
ncbi:unnamed protein product [Rotaria sp. Silwood2]|nr:unnamed protein product [Rotaria sp. Silwood2]CAF4480541.1 unnamed protein product [Rotaria sp. Silwood2]CAF4666537.1 unnamed protein product [Rotaria sp. Silwood2]